VPSDPAANKIHSLSCRKISLYVLLFRPRRCSEIRRCVSVAAFLASSEVRRYRSTCHSLRGYASSKIRDLCEPDSFLRVRNPNNTMISRLRLLLQLKSTSVNGLGDELMEWVCLSGCGSPLKTKSLGVRILTRAHTSLAPITNVVAIMSTPLP